LRSWRPAPKLDAMTAPRRIAIVAYPDCHSLDVCGPAEVFNAANELLAGTARCGYEVGVATMDGCQVSCSSGLIMGANWSLPTLDDVDTVLIAGGTGSRAAARDAMLLEQISTLAGSARRTGSVCTGAFVLAATGLLNGRRATTHWASAARLAERHPEVILDPDAIFTRDGDVWTSAGVTAGMDLALAMVSADHDDELAREVAQWLVMYLRRAGGQSQFSAPMTTAGARRDEIRRVQDWIAADPSRDCSIAALAATAAMSPRHFARTFSDQVGVSPGRYVESCRVDWARALLETTNLTVGEVAGRTGIGDASTLHRLFDKRLGTTPAAYRIHFKDNYLNPRSTP